MTRILSSSEILPEVKKMTSQGHDLTFAVAYWGKGATEELGLLNSERKTRITLNVEHGGTNPSELETLIRNPSIDVRIHSQLHAKIYASNDKAILGSANASRNGLHWDETGHVEAAALVEGAAAKAAKKLALKIFEDSRPATDKDIDLCRERFRRVPMAQQLSALEYSERSKSKTLKTLLDNDHLLGEMPFIISADEPGEESYNQDLQLVKSSIKNGRIRLPSSTNKLTYFEGCLHEDYLDKFCFEIHQMPEGCFTLYYVHLLPLPTKLGRFAERLKLSDAEVFHGHKKYKIKFTEEENKELSRALKNMQHYEFYLGRHIFQKLREQMS